MTSQRRIASPVERASRLGQFRPGHVSGRVASAQPIRRNGGTLRQTSVGSVEATEYWLVRVDRGAEIPDEVRWTWQFPDGITLPPLPDEWLGIYGHFVLYFLGSGTLPSEVAMASYYGAEGAGLTLLDYPGSYVEGTGYPADPSSFALALVIWESAGSFGSTWYPFMAVRWMPPT